MTKLCPMCKRELPLNCFPADSSGGYKPHCIACKKTYIKTEDQLRDRRKRFMKHQKLFDTRHDQNKAPGANVYKKYLKDMKKLYSIDEEIIRDQFDAQLGCCSSCGVSLYFPDSVHFPVYEKGEFLCVQCAVILTYSQEQEAILQGVLNFIRRHNA